MSLRRLNRKVGVAAALLLMSAGLVTFPTPSVPAQTSPNEQGLGLIFSERGRVSLSMNGLGTNSTGGQIRIVKPAGATVRRAVLFAATTGLTNYRLSQASPVNVDGVGL